MDPGPAVVGEVRAFKHRDLTLGLPHTFAIAVIYVTAMLAMYFKLWLAAALFFAFFWTARPGWHPLRSVLVGDHPPSSLVTAHPRALTG